MNCVNVTSHFVLPYNLILWVEISFFSFMSPHYEASYDIFNLKEGMMQRYIENILYELRRFLNVLQDNSFCLILLKLDFYRF